jgi:hypothetical protein
LVPLLVQTFTAAPGASVKEGKVKTCGTVSRSVQPVMLRLYRQSSGFPQTPRPHHPQAGCTRFESSARSLAARWSGWGWVWRLVRLCWFWDWGVGRSGGEGGRVLRPKRDRQVAKWGQADRWGGGRISGLMPKTPTTAEKRMNRMVSLYFLGIIPPFRLLNN